MSRATSVLIVTGVLALVVGFFGFGVYSMYGKLAQSINDQHAKIRKRACDRIRRKMPKYECE